MSLSTMDLIDTGSDPWILEYDACEEVCRAIMEHLNARNSDRTSAQEYDALSAKIRIKLKQFSTELFELNRKLNVASVVSSLTHEERERRKRLVEVLQSKEVQLRDYFNQKKSSDNSELMLSKSRALLFEKKKGATVTDLGTTSWGESRISENNDFDSSIVADIKNENERLLKEQNEGLESLLKIVSNQKQIANAIHSEVEHHNEILVDIADDMERYDGRVTQTTEMVQQIGKKDSIWGYWLIAFLLLIAILGVAFA